MGIVDRTGPRVRAKREERGWSQTKLAQEAGTTLDRVSRIERGASKAKPEELVGFSRSLEVSIEWLIGVEGEDEPTGPRIIPSLRDWLEKKTEEQQKRYLDALQVLTSRPKLAAA